MIAVVKPLEIIFYRCRLLFDRDLFLTGCLHAVASLSALERILQNQNFPVYFGKNCK